MGRWMKGFHLHYTFVIQNHIKEGLSMGALDKVIAFQNEVLSKKNLKKLYMKLSIMIPEL